MKVVVCVVLASIFVNTVKAGNSKQVNLALETVLNFDKKDRTADLEVIDKVQNFLEQIKDAMQQGNARRNTKQDVTLTDFILEAAMILKEFDDIALEDAYVIMNEESRRYINKESKFQDFFDSNAMRRFVSDQLNEAKEIPAFLLRRTLDSAIAFIESQNKSGDMKNLLDIGNSLYNGASNKFMVALRNLDKVRRSAGEINLEQVLKGTLRSLIFDYYSNLSSRVRGELINIFKHYWPVFSGNDKHTEPKMKVVDSHEGRGQKHRAYSPTERTHKKHEVIPSNHELKKFVKNKKEDKPKNSFSVYKGNSWPYVNSEPKKGSFSVYKSNDWPYSNSEPKKVDNGQSFGRVKSSPQLHSGNYWPYRNSESKKVDNRQSLGRVKSSPKLQSTKKFKNDRTEDRESIQHSELSTSSEPKVLMGGQMIRDIHFRVDKLSRQVSESSDTESHSSTEEIVIQHSNIVDVGLSRKTPGRLNITFVSSETHNTERENSNVSISLENKVMRKSNVNDRLETNVDLLNVNLLIKKIEREIEDVKDQVEQVKTLAKTGISKSNESLLTMSAKNTTVAETPRKDNGFAFRAIDDSGYSEVEIEAKKEVTNTTSAATTDTTEANIVNGSKISDVGENTSEIINFNNNKNPDKSKEREIGDTNQTYDANKAKYLKVTTDMQNDTKFTENDKDEHKNEDQENTIIKESNLNTTATTLEDFKIDVQFDV